MSNYARQMARLSAQIFGEQVREVPIKSKKVCSYIICEYVTERSTCFNEH